MKIESGKHYQMRDGRIVGPVQPWDENNLSVGYHAEQKLDGYYLMWDEEGKFDGFVVPSANDKHAHLDLVAAVGKPTETPF